MADLDLSNVDLDEVLKKLTLHARRLFFSWVRLAGKDTVLQGLGDGPEDLAVASLLKFLDPEDYTVTWKKKYGHPTTGGVLAYLKPVLNNDFLDLLKKKAHETTVIVDVRLDGNQEDDEEKRSRRTLSLDEFAAEVEGPEGQAIRTEKRAALLARLESEPELRDMLEVQLEPDGYCAYTNQDLARLLNTTVSEVENRKKRLDRRLLGILVEMEARSPKEEHDG